MQLEKNKEYETSLNNKKSFDKLFQTITEINVEDIKNKIKINHTSEWIEFNIYNHNIWFILLSKNNNQLLWIDTINLCKVKNNLRIRWLGYFMVKYAIWLCKSTKFEIANITKDLIDYYKKIAFKLKEENITSSYKFVWWSYKDLILDLK